MPYSICRPLNLDERNLLSEHSDFLAHLLFYRNIKTADQARSFINPEYESGTHDPFLLKDAEIAAKRIVKAVKNNEKICIYSDYDADGIPGAAIFHDFFGRIGFSNFFIYIPHRHNEGFGVNKDAVQKIIEDGAKLIVTIDCGITDVLPITLAKENGVDVIVTDHHEAPPILPPAIAIIDHKQSDCSYPDKNICGSGVAYKLIQAILKVERFGLKDGMEKWLLDLVGIATLSDMVPLVGENRIFAKYGLSVLRKSPRKGLVQLLRKLNISQRHLTEDDIAFMITPRINAASRMGVPMDAFKMLAARDENEAYESVEHLDKINKERKGVVASLVKEVKKVLSERYLESIPNVIVLGNPNWRPALLGLVANSCAEELNRPVFLWGRDGDSVIKGSCRSEGKSNVVEIMRAVPSGVFSQYGGHHHSGGFAVHNERIHHLDEELNRAAAAVSDSKATAEELKKEAESIDLEIKLDDVNRSTYAEIEKMAPFGIGNQKPVFLLRNIYPASLRKFGKANEHVELSFRASAGNKISAISFFGAESSWVKQYVQGKSVDLIANIEKSMFRGREEIRLRIIDVLYS